MTSENSFVFSQNALFSYKETMHMRFKRYKKEKYRKKYHQFDVFSEPYRLRKVLSMACKQKSVHDSKITTTMGQSARGDNI